MMTVALSIDWHCELLHVTCTLLATHADHVQKQWPVTIFSSPGKLEDIAVPHSTMGLSEWEHG